MSSSMMAMMIIRMANSGWKPRMKSTGILSLKWMKKILKFITSFKIGSFLSLEVLVGFADKYECHTSSCGALFYSRSLFEEHKASHGSGTDNKE